jgi:hypothetical protein
MEETVEIKVLSVLVVHHGHILRKATWDEHQRESPQQARIERLSADRFRQVSFDFKRARQRFLVLAVEVLQSFLRCKNFFCVLAS